MGSPQNNSSPSDDSCLIPPVEVKSSESSTKFTKEQDEKSLRDLMDTLHPAKSGRPRKSSGQSTPPTTSDAPPSTPESSCGSLFKPPADLPSVKIGEDLEGFGKILAERGVYNVDRLTYMAGQVETQILVDMEPGEISRLVNTALRLRKEAVMLALKIAGDFKEVLKKKKESVEA